MCQFTHSGARRDAAIQMFGISFSRFVPSEQCEWSVVAKRKNIISKLVEWEISVYQVAAVAR